MRAIGNAPFIIGLHGSAAMEYEIKFQCKECDGFGYIEHQRSETSFYDHTCPECEGEQFKTVYETYDTVGDLRADYPDAIIQEMHNEYYAQGEGG